MDAHERDATNARLELIEQKIQELSTCGISPAERARRGFALQGEWVTLCRQLGDVESDKQVRAMV